jgi:hypothetical protein
MTKKIRSVELTLGIFKFLTIKYYAGIRYAFRCSQKGTSLGQAPGFTIKHKTRLESPASDKHSSLLDPFEDYAINYFITWAYGCNVIKLLTAIIY